MVGAKSLTKAAIAEQVRAENLEKAASTSDEELRNWSHRTFEDLRVAEATMLQKRDLAQRMDAARKDARTAHRTAGSPETSAAWRQAVAASEVAQEELRIARDARNRLQALSELLASLLKQRRVVAGEAPSRIRRGEAPQESCPYCEHHYTVRDGTLPQTDAEGQRLQLRKCQCREMAPPCRNCPICRADADVMAAQDEEQLRLCRDHLQCAVCACECPGAGKWIEGDPDSRAKYKERAAKRHDKLSALLQVSWSGGGNAGSEAAQVDFASSGLRRLPADIKDQLDAVAAAQTLQFSMLERPPSASAMASHGPPTCCCGEEMGYVPRPGRKRRYHSNCSADGEEDAALAKAASNRAQTTTEGHQKEEGVDDESETVQREQQATGIYKREEMLLAAQHLEDEHEHHHHIHRCAHPHNECTSSCCSAAGGCV